jgi:hypothetical protein
LSGLAEPFVLVEAQIGGACNASVDVLTHPCEGNQAMPLEITKAARPVNTADWGIERRIKLSRDLAVTLTIGPSHACCEWHPTIPDKLSPTQWRRYRAGRDRLVAQVAARMGGGKAIVLEPQADGAIEGRVLDAES